MPPQELLIAVVVLPVQFHFIFPEGLQDASQGPSIAGRVPDVVADRPDARQPDRPAGIIATVLRQRFRVGDPFGLEPHDGLHAVGPGKVRGLKEGVPGPFLRVEGPGPDRAPPVLLRAGTVGRDIPARVEPPEVRLRVFREHLLKGRLPGRAVLRDAAVGVGLSGVACDAAGGKRREGEAPAVRFGQVVGDEPAAPVIGGIVLIAHRVRRPDEERGADLVPGTQPGPQPVDRPGPVFGNALPGVIAEIRPPGPRPADGQHHPAVAVFQVEVGKAHMRGPPAVGLEMPGLGGDIQRVGPVVVPVIPQDPLEGGVFPREGQHGLRVGDHVRVPLPPVLKPHGPFRGTVHCVVGAAQRDREGLVHLKDDLSGLPAGLAADGPARTGEHAAGKTLYGTASVGEPEREGGGIPEDRFIPGVGPEIAVGNGHGGSSP